MGATWSVQQAPSWACGSVNVPPVATTGVSGDPGRRPLSSDANRPRSPLTSAELESLRDYVERAFLVPFLTRRGVTPPAWGADLPPRLSLTQTHLQILRDNELVERDALSWRKLAEERRLSVSTLTRRFSSAQDWLGTTRFLLFRDPGRWNLNELLRSRGDAQVRARLEAEADAQCEVFDQTRRASFTPYVPVPLRRDDPRRLSDVHRDLLGWAARSLRGPRALYLAVQGATGKPSTVNLTPHLDLQPPAAAQGTLHEREIQLNEALERFEQLARQRLEEQRAGLSPAHGHRSGRGL